MTACYCHIYSILCCNLAVNKPRHATAIYRPTSNCWFDTAYNVAPNEMDVYTNWFFNIN